MTALAPPRYDRSVALRFALLVALCVALAAPARAAGASLDVGDQAIVNVTVRGPRNAVEIRTWDRPSVEVESDQPTQIGRRSVLLGVAGGLPLAQPLPPAVWRGPDGPAIVPPEIFPLAGLRPGAHDVVVVAAPPGSHVTITVPASIGLLRALVGGGTTTIDGYRGANLFVVQNQGRLRIGGGSTTAFVQLGNGLIEADGATFDRLRVRANAASVIFEGCRTRQIETTTIRGNVVYDGGSFDPGLARFESQSGSIALGVRGDAQLAGRSLDGRVFTSFEQRAAVEQTGPNAATATLGNGRGPLVNALSAHGDVFLYDGSLRARRTVPPAFRPLHQALTRRRQPRRR